MMAISNDLLVDLDLEFVRAQAQAVLKADSYLIALLDAREMVRLTRADVTERVPPNHPVACELRDLSQQLNAEIDRRNDVQAKVLVQRVKGAISSTKDQQVARQPILMGHALGRVKYAIAEVQRAKTYLRFAIERISNGKPYFDVLLELSAEAQELFDGYCRLRAEIEAENAAQLATAARLLSEQVARAERLSRDLAPRAQELHTTFLASIKAGKVDDAQKALAELNSDNIRHGLIGFLGSAQKRDDFYCSAKEDLGFLIGMEERRAQNMAKMRKVPHLPS